MSLPLNWVDKIFAKLALTYGHAFLSRWDGLPMDEVKADWALELRGFAQSPDAIKHALEHLPPDRPPTVLEFRNLCIRRPEVSSALLPSPKVNKEIMRRCLEGLKPLPTENTDRPGLAWAHRIMARHEAGDFIHKATLGLAKSALGAA